MTPQAAFLVLAPVRAQREAELRALFDSITASPGHADPKSALLPFAKFETLHFARLCIVKDDTVGDVAVYGESSQDYPTYFAFLGDVDESAEGFLAEAAARAGTGLSAMFACCEGFDPGTDLLRWMKAHNVRASASYVNWKGRTLRQIREEAALRESMTTYLDANAHALAEVEPLELHTILRHYLSGEIAAARLQMTPPEPTRLGWWIRDFLGIVGPPLVLIVLSPLLLVVVVILLLIVRMRENSDPEICPRVDRHSDVIAVSEDRDVTNPFSAIGSLKPGAVRLLASISALGVLDYAARHIYTTGRLARVRTIHFARWVCLDGKRRLLFLSNYDGSLESYMDDFINKAGFGLNLVFSNGIGYPKTRWLVAGGSKNEEKFENFLYRHEFPTQVWYNAHPGLTAVDLDRNGRIRTGLESPSLSAQEAREWAALL